MFLKVSRARIFISFFIMLFAAGCGRTDCSDGQDGARGADGADGSDGKVYIAFTWVSINWLSVSMPGLPGTIYSAAPYQTSAGTYSFQYESWNGRSYSGTVTLSSDEGQSGQRGQPGTPGEPSTNGGLLKDCSDGADGATGRSGSNGADGDDIWYELLLFSSGWTLYAWPDPSYLGKEMNNSAELNQFKKAVGADAIGKPSIERIEPLSTPIQ